MGKHSIYVVLTRTNTVLSRMIRCYTKDEYSHASISFDKELKSMYSFSRKYTFNPFVGVLKKEDIDDGLYKISKEIPCKIIEVQISREQYLKAKKLLYTFLAKKDCFKYSYKGLLYCALNMECSGHDRFLCSEFVYYILRESGIADFKMPANLVRPQTLLNLKGNVIYQGDMKELSYEGRRISNNMPIGALCSNYE